MIKYLPLLFLFVACQTHVHLAEATEDTEIVDSDYSADPETESIIEPYREQMSEEMDKVIGKSAITMTKGGPESLLGNWVADELHKAAQKMTRQEVAFALQNSGGLRIPELPKGPITKGKIYELMPFDNMLVMLLLDAERMQAMLDKIADSGGWPVSQGLEMKIVDQKPVDVRIGGKPYDPQRTYVVAFPDYVANGGGGCDFLVGAPSIETGLFIRDVLIDAVRDSEEKGKPITSKITGRIKNR